MKLTEQQMLAKRLSEFPGNYECHITVEIEPRQIEQFKKVCAQLDSKSLVIVLDNGQYPRQPMLAKILKGSPAEVVCSIESIHNELSKLFRIIRIKVETEFGCPSLPSNRVEASGLPKDCYFEFHVRIKLPKDEALDDLRREVKIYDGHLSNNALSENEETFENDAVLKKITYQQRFITQRFRNVGKDEAEQGLEKLLNFLKQKKLHVDKVVREFNIFDSNAYLDSGWANE